MWKIIKNLKYDRYLGVIDHAAVHMSAVAFTIHVTLYCVAVLFVAVGLLQHSTYLWMSGAIIGVIGILFCRCTCTGLICHLFDRDLPIVMEADHPVLVRPDTDIEDLAPMEMDAV